MDQTHTNIAESFAPAVPLPRSLSVDLDPIHSTGRQKLETCIADKFDQQYQAEISHFLPYLLSLSESEQLDAVVGIQLAGKSDLFLERYLDAPVEQAISRACQTPVDRGQVVEIGNLAAAVPGTASLLFGVLATVLHRAGVRWVACTATPQVHAMLKSLKFPTHTICDADASAMGEEAGEWGDYYSSRPQVIVGDTRLAAEAVASSRVVHVLSRKLARPINDAAAALKKARQ